MLVCGIVLFFFGFLFLLLSDVLEELVGLTTIFPIADQAVKDKEQHDDSRRHSMMTPAAMSTERVK